MASQRTTQIPGRRKKSDSSSFLKEIWAKLRAQRLLEKERERWMMTDVKNNSSSD